MEWVRSLPVNLQLEMLHHLDRRIREAAAKALLEDSDFLAVESLIIVVLQDTNEHVREIAARALGNIGDVRAVEPLVAALKDGSVDVRRAAAGALESIGDDRAVEPLITALRDVAWLVRGAAARALEKIDPDWPRSKAAQTQVPHFIAELQDENQSVRWWAAETLGNIGDPRALAPLITSLKDEDNDVRRAAARALGKIGEASAAEARFSHEADNNHRLENYVGTVAHLLKQLLGWNSHNQQ